MTKPSRTALHPELQDLFSRAGQSALSKMLADLHIEEQWKDEEKKHWWEGLKTTI